MNELNDGCNRVYRAGKSHFGGEKLGVGMILCPINSPHHCRCVYLDMQITNQQTMQHEITELTEKITALKARIAQDEKVDRSHLSFRMKLSHTKALKWNRINLASLTMNLNDALALA